MKTKLLLVSVFSIITISICGQSENNYFNLAVSELKAGNPQAAIKYLDKAINLDNDNIDAYLIRGYAKGQLKDYKGAIHDFNAILKLDPKNSSAYDHRGICKKNLGDYQGALSDYNSAIKFNPKNAQAFNNRAVVKYYFLTDTIGACNDWKKSGNLGYKKAHELYFANCPSENSNPDITSTEQDDAERNKTRERYKSMAMSDSEFYNFVKENKIAFSLPDGFMKTKVVANADMPYHYAIKLIDIDFEQRFYVESIAEMREKFKDVKNFNPNELYNSVFVTSIMNVSQAEPKYEHFKPDDVRKEFAADDGMFSAFYADSEYGTNYKYGFMMVLHKNDVANIYVTFLGNDQEKFNEYMVAGFYTLKFIE